jgi:hypothetical protein
MFTLSILGDAKMRRKKSRLNHHSPKEVPYGFQHGFHMEHSLRKHFIPATASSSAFVRIMVHSQKLRVPATKKHTKKISK